MTEKKYIVIYEDNFKKEFAKLSTEQQKTVLKKIQLFENNPYYPSLRTKPLKNNYESSVNMDIRIIWRIDGLQITVFDIGHHDIIRKYNKHKY
jgi:mRNA-degrading endonuclease RelE of RelBE toxin-antitoxin system